MSQNFHFRKDGKHLLLLNRSRQVKPAGLDGSKATSSVCLLDLPIHYSSHRSLCSSGFTKWSLKKQYVFWLACMVPMITALLFKNGAPLCLLRYQNAKCRGDGREKGRAQCLPPSALIQKCSKTYQSPYGSRKNNKANLYNSCYIPQGKKSIPTAYISSFTFLKISPVPRKKCTCLLIKREVAAIKNSNYIQTAYHCF